MLDWWMEASGWMRWGLCVFFLAISTVLWFFEIIWPYGWMIGGVVLFANLFINDDSFQY